MGHPRSEKILRDFHKLIEGKNVESEEELQELFASFMKEQNMKKPISGGSDEDIAQDLVYEAMESEPAKAQKLLKKAKKLDPDNPDIYNLLGEMEMLPGQALKHHQKALRLCKKQLGNEFIEENRGHFWGIVETRPYIRALKGVADCYYFLSKFEDSIDVMEEIIDLNPLDNQGVRYTLTKLYLLTEKYDEYQKLYEMYEDDAGATWVYDYVLYLFKTEGDSEKTRQALKEALETNKYFPQYLLKSKVVPHEIPEYYSFGSEDEGVICYYESKDAWKFTKGAIDWLRKNVKL